MQHRNTRMSDIVRKFFHFVVQQHTTYQARSRPYEDMFAKSVKHCDTDKKYTGVIHQQGHYIDTNIRATINQQEYKRVSIEYITQESVPVKVIIFYRKTSKSNLKRIMYVLSFMIFYCKTINPSFSGSIDVTIVLSSHKKVLPNKGELGPVNVNSGFTSRDFSNNTSSIVIYRKEEVMKVLIHEVLHAFDIDSKRINSQAEKPVADFFKLTVKGRGHQHLSINESFTDTYACILNVAVAAMLMSQDIVQRERIFLKLLRVETAHVCTMAAKVMKYVGLELMSGDTIPQMSSLYSENTHVISYYLLKALNMLNIVQFVKFLSSNDMTIGSISKYSEYMMSSISSVRWQCDVVSKDKVIFPQHKMPLNSIAMSSIDVLQI